MIIKDACPLNLGEEWVNTVKCLTETYKIKEEISRAKEYND